MNCQAIITLQYIERYKSYYFSCKAQLNDNNTEFWTSIVSENRAKELASQYNIEIINIPWIK